MQSDRRLRHAGRSRPRGAFRFHGRFIARHARHHRTRSNYGSPHRLGSDDEDVSGETAKRSVPSVNGSPKKSSAILCRRRRPLRKTHASTERIVQFATRRGLRKILCRAFRIYVQTPRPPMKCSSALAIESCGGATRNPAAFNRAIFRHHPSFA